jgi:Spy/CpxP family protein refolding chaperone
MKINKISMAIMAAASLLAVSPAVYAQSTNGAAAAAGGRARGGGLTVDAIDKAVTLTDAEKPKVKAALEDYMTAMKEARTADQSERKAKATAAQDALNTALKGILTPDQYTKYEAMPKPKMGGRRGGAGGGAGGGAAPAAN